MRSYASIPELNFNQEQLDYVKSCWAQLIDTDMERESDYEKSKNEREIMQLRNNILRDELEERKTENWNLRRQCKVLVFSAVGMFAVSLAWAILISQAVSK